MGKLGFYVSRIKSGRLKEMARQTAWIYNYGRRYWAAMIFYTILGFVGTGFGLLASWISKTLVDIITGVDRNTTAVIQTFAFMIGFNIANLLISQFSEYVSGYISMKVDAEIKTDIFEKIMVTDWESLQKYHTGDLLTRWSSDCSSISSGILSFIPNLLIYTFRFIAAFAMVAWHDWTFAVLALAGMPVSLLLSKTLMKRMVNNNKRSAAMGAKLSGFNQETFSNIQTIKAFSLIRLYIERLKSLQKEYIQMRLDFKKMSIWTSLLLSVVGLVVSYASYGWGIYRVWTGAISYGTMTMFLTLSGTLTGTLSNLTSLVPMAIGLTTSAGRLMDIVEMPRENYDQDDAVEEFYKAHQTEGISLGMEGVKYAYHNGTEVFDGASLEAKPHEIIALVGPSGEGKTTMLRLILSLVRPKGGSAYLYGGSKDPGFDGGAALGEGEEGRGDGRMMLSPSTRRLFSYVPQGNTMFSGTIAENMRNVKVDATDEEIIDCLKLACAWEFVEKLPDGINSMIHERGGGFSEGQAQRLSIARALIRKSPLLLLDEATSALDVATERRVLKNIMMDDYPRTCIVTTHRPTVLSACNRVYAIREKRCTVLTEDEIDRLVSEF